MNEALKQSNTATWLKGILPLLVVIIHTSHSADLYIWESTEGFLRELFYVTGSLAVPVFFFISGHYFFKGLGSWSWPAWGQKLKKRLKTLLLPYLCWIAIAFVFKFISGYLHSEIASFDLASVKSYFLSSGGFRMFYDQPFQEFSQTILGTDIIHTRPINGPLWFVRDLMAMCVLAPLLFWLIRRGGRIFIGILAALFVLNIEIPVPGFSASALLFFSAGAYFSINNLYFTVELKKIDRWSYILSIIFLCVIFALKATPYRLACEISCNMFALTAAVAAMNLACGLVTGGSVTECKILTSSSFFIYAAHSLVMDLANFLLWRSLPFTAEWVLVLKVFLRPAVTVGICLLIFVTMRKLCPKFLGLLTGGRN